MIRPFTIAPAQLDELFQERQSTRFFKKDKIEREQLKEIARYGIYAPMENFRLRAIIVDDEAILEELEHELMKILSRMTLCFPAGIHIGVSQNNRPHLPAEQS